jgi:hypothetical protein
LIVAGSAGVSGVSVVPAQVDVLQQPDGEEVANIEEPPYERRAAADRSPA